jgi:superfamily II DNA or RNA helicase
MNSISKTLMFDLNGIKFLRFIETIFHPGTRAKAERIVAENKIVSFQARKSPGAWELTAKVQGSAPAPYEVRVLCGEMTGEIFLNDRCTCPLLHHCKHIFAVLRAAGKTPLSALPAPPPPRKEIAPPPKPEPPKPRLPGEWQIWLKQMEQAAAPAASADMKSEGASRTILYILKPTNPKGAVPVEFAQGHLTTEGRILYGHSLPAYQMQAYMAGQSFSRSDRDLVRKIIFSRANGVDYNTELTGETGAELLAEILATGRCRWRSLAKNRPPLLLGAKRPARAAWKIDAKGWQQPVLDVTPPAAVILPVLPPWYVDEQSHECGPLETELPSAVALEWLRAPKLAPEEAALLKEEMPKAQAAAALPLPAQIEIENLPRTKPVPCLKLYGATIPSAMRFAYPRKYGEDDGPLAINLAHLEFDYKGTRFDSSDRELMAERFENGKLLRLKRDLKSEDALRASLWDEGLTEASEIYYSLRGDNGADLTFEDENDWFHFVRIFLPELKAAGWQVETDASFTFRLAEAEAWYADAQAESGLDWFSTEIGVQVEGQKINLLPLLLRQIQTNPGFLNPQTLKELSKDAEFLVPLPDGRHLPFPVERLKPLLGVLLELFDPKVLDGSGRLRLSKLRAAELSGLAGTDSWRWLGGETLRALGEKLRDFRSIQPVPVPAGLQATLRGYQQDGLNWLQFLREYNLGGVLADDMGLGKTIQALAHLLEEKNSGRADCPSLVVAPTSLMTNWRQEVEKFAPSLKLLVLHGLGRKEHFEKMRDYDLIVTSYPLLPRDEAVLLKEQFHLVVLDEAQYIKNPKTKYAQIVCQLRARHHLCLTGTPMENHLGELWSQFNFLLPGLLGDETRFRKVFRNPIEQNGDTDRRQLLARRIGPFLLRRSKQEVATELPPKTEIVQNVELAGAQRDLYETIRLAMHAKVRAAVDEKGISRAHIIILDALLKLRQVCCDPRLVKLDSARAVKESAKLELLMDMLPGMLAEGRKILLFSQFTSMLALIEKELARASIQYSLLTGDTVNRAQPIERFQKGEVPLFLISLKAGGTGLNLTAADTVIHYDPWWNPAVENQATDRAHRIGQTKSVFVYKLMTLGTVEEKILALQKRKSELVAGLLDENRKATLKISAEDLQDLFTPLG